MRVEERPINPALLTTEDAATAAALVAHEDARRSGELAREERRAARADRLGELRQVADKLRELAGCALGSALWQGGLTMAAAGLQGTACLKKLEAQPDAAGRLQGAALHAASGASRLDGAARWLEARPRADPLSVAQGQVAVSRQEHEVAAEQAGNRAQDAGETLAEAQRLQASCSGSLQKLEDARHAALLAATRV